MKLRFLHRAWKARCLNQGWEIRAATRAIRPGDLVLDIGANKGAYLYWLRRAVGPKGKVLAFEPQRLLHDYLRLLIDELAWDNVFVNPAAISNHTGRGILHVPGRFGPSPRAALAVDPGWSTYYETECDTRTLDSMSFDRRVSFIKCNVQGHELFVFEGGKKLLRKEGPVLLFECEARHLRGNSVEDVFGFLEGLGYRGQFFAGRKLLPMSAFSVATHQQRRGPRYWGNPGYCTNFLFRKNG